MANTKTTPKKNTVKAPVASSTPTDIIKNDVAKVKTANIKAEAKAPEARTKTKQARKKTREINELLAATVKSMSDKEKENLINYLKDELAFREKLIQQYKENCEAAYEKLRNMENDYKAMDSWYTDRLQYIDEHTKAFAKALQFAIVGGIQ